MEKIKEAMKGKRLIKNPLIIRYIDECIEDMKKMSFGFKDEKQILTYDDIDAEEGSTLNTFGVMSLPPTGIGNFKLILNKHMFNDPEEAIKNTIYHELCHYVVYKVAIHLEIIYTKNGKWYKNKKHNAVYRQYSGHGSNWKRVAAIVGKATNQDITRASNYDAHAGVGDYAESRYNYIIKCSNCGREFKYVKRTEFVSAVLNGNGYTENWWCNCDDGKKGHHFEILKGK